MSHPLQNFSAPRQARGIGLIEVLVSVLVLAVGLIGIAAMQSLALRGGQGSLEASQAVMQTNSIIEAMRANRVNAAAYNTGTKICTAPSGTGLADKDKAAWLTALKANIGGGASTCGQITGCPNACVVTVFWDDTRAGDGAAREMKIEGVRI